MFFPVIDVILLSLLASIVGLGVEWLLIYRTDRYKEVQGRIDMMKKQVERAKDAAAKSAKSKKSRISTFEQQQRSAEQEMAMIRLKSTFATFAILGGFMAFLVSIYEGRVVAMLPFEPFALLRALTHRSLPGSIAYHCSMHFIYVLGSMSFRANLARIFGIQAVTPTLPGFPSMPSSTAT